jgi:hypothetical protein
MAPDVRPVFPPEAVEPHQYLRPSDALPSEPNESDASGGARRDAAVDGCPSGHPDRLADADVGKLAGRARVDRPADACLAPVYPQPELEV